MSSLALKRTISLRMQLKEKMRMKYYVHTKTDNQGDHEVHIQNCGYLPSEQNRQYLGEFNDCSSAVKKAKELGYKPTNGCYYCCNECHTS